MILNVVLLNRLSLLFIFVTKGHSVSEAANFKKDKNEEKDKKDKKEENKGSLIVEFYNIL